MATESRTSTRVHAPIFGIPVGVIMQCDSLIRIPGDVGNALSFPFPVHYRLVDDFTRPDGSSDIKSLDAVKHTEAVVRAGLELEALGVRAVTCGCGYMALFQPALSKALSIPVLASSLIQIPLVSTLVGNRPIGILTADSTRLREEHFEAAGWSTRDFKVRIAGVEQDADFRAISNRSLDPAHRFEHVERGMVRTATALKLDNPDLAAFVFECTNMPPYAAAVQQATGLPVFDIVTLIESIHTGVCRQPYS